MAKKPASYLAGSMLLGTAIGAVVGLLTAPVAGKELRGTLRRRVSEASAAGSSRLKEMPRQLRDLPEAGQRLVASLPEQGRRMVARVVPGWRPVEQAEQGTGEEVAEEASPPERPAEG
jgi:gas vesicle protein